MTVPKMTAEYRANRLVSAQGRAFGQRKATRTMQERIAARFASLKADAAGLTSANDKALYFTALVDAAHAVADTFEDEAGRIEREAFMTACGFPLYSGEVLVDAPLTAKDKERLHVLREQYNEFADTDKTGVPFPDSEEMLNLEDREGVAL